MSKYKDRKAWKQKAPDIAYNDPFSESTAKTRRLLMFWASLSLLNNFYPINLGESNLLGLKFIEGNTPPIAGLLVFVVFYFLVIYSIYVFQEIKSWLAQANEVAFEEYNRGLLDIYSHHSTIQNSLDSAAGFLVKYQDSIGQVIESFEQAEERSQKVFDQINSEVLSHAKSFGNFCRIVEKATEAYGKEIESASELLQEARSDYNAALIAQKIKIGILEVLVPIAMGLIATLLSIKVVFQYLFSAV